MGDLGDLGDLGDFGLGFFLACLTPTKSRIRYDFPTFSLFT